MTNLTGKSEQITALHQLGSVEFLRSGAYVRLNDIAKPFGKRLNNWMRLKTTKELFEAFKVDRSYNGAKAFYTIQGGNTVPSDLRERSETLAAQGTFVHPDVKSDRTKRSPLTLILSKITQSQSLITGAESQ